MATKKLEYEDCRKNVKVSEEAHRVLKRAAAKANSPIEDVATAIVLGQDLFDV